MDETNEMSWGRRLLRFLGRSLSVILVTILIMAIFLTGVILLLSKGPSLKARDQFVRSVNETSAIGFLSEFFLTEE